ncbi:MAG: DegT/DnrJ/EryC1/StrS family aminotransferase [Sphingobacteriia bacterium]|jgi:dTDP-4-amino-4,6-dideoxygalactose transaminase
MIPYDNLYKVNEKYTLQLKTAFDHFLEKGWYILGDGVKEFEANFAAYHQMKYCVGVANGLDALTLSLLALNLPKGSEIIVQSNTYIASILGIIHAGHIPILVEPVIDTYNIDPQKIAEALSPKTKAIMVVHLYGKCCAMDPITAIAQQNNLHIIEDCAQAHGAKYKGKLAGTFGTMSGFSFYPSKNLGALGDAGATLTNNAQHWDSLIKLRNYGSQKKYFNDVVGFNSRLDELQALFLSIKLPYLDEINRQKRRFAQLYLDNLKEDYIKPLVDSDFYDVYHIFNIRHPKRDELKAYLLGKGIGSEIHYPVSPSHQKALNGLIKDQNFPISEEIHATTLSLPCSSCHTESDIAQVIDALNAF